MSAELDTVKSKVLTRVIERIHDLDRLERYEESYVLTEEFREWLLDPQLDPTFSSDCAF